MITKHSLIQYVSLCIVAALPLLQGVASSCTKDSFETVIKKVEQPTGNELPVEDQMKVRVTVPMASAVPSAFDEGSTGAALVNRLSQVTTDITPNTRLVLLKGSDFSADASFSPYIFESAVRMFLNGGYIALVQPTGEQIAWFSLSLLVTVTGIEQANYQAMFDIDETVAARAAQSSETIERLKTRSRNLQAAATRAGSKDLNVPFAEIIILGLTDYFMQEPLIDKTTAYIHSEDSDGNPTLKETVMIETERTPYISGRLADAAAIWLNTMEKEPASAVRRTVTRAGGSAINEIMDANETFTYNGAVAATTNYNYTGRYENRVNMILRSWGIHNMESNRDYYYVKQDVTLRMGDDNELGHDIFFPTSSEDSWWPVSDFGQYNMRYGSWLSQYETSIDLDGSGDIVLEAATPGTDNMSSSTSVSIGSSSSSTVTNGISWGGSAGANAAGPMGSINIGGSHTEGTTTGTSFTMGMSTTQKDLGVIKNTLDTKVTWTYNGSMPQYYERKENDGLHPSHQTAADILVNDCDVTNEICWSVGNPSGQYSVNITSAPQTAALLYVFKNEDGYKNAPHKYEYATADTENYIHTLLEPNRAMQTWRMYLTIDEWVNGVVSGALGQLETNVQKQFPDLYANVFTVADRTVESLNTISYIINYSKRLFNSYYSVLQARALDLGIKQFSIHWCCDDMNIGERVPFTVNAGATAQAVWCNNNKTLYFLCSDTRFSAGDKWDGQTVTDAWIGEDVTNLSLMTNPKWFDYSSNYATRVVFDPSFASVRPKKCQYWFAGCYKLATIEGIEYLDTSEVTSMNGMFGNCEKLASINVDGFDMSKVTDVRQMFYGCNNLATIYCGQTWNFSIPASSGMFYDCKNLKGAVAYDSSKVSATMANPDTGYFTRP